MREIGGGGREEETAIVSGQRNTRQSRQLQHEAQASETRVS